jgi:hypothetical protein
MQPSYITQNQRGDAESKQGISTKNDFWEHLECWEKAKNTEQNKEILEDG